jgi:hypothetical protein
MRKIQRLRARAVHARFAAAGTLLVALLAVAGGAAHSVSAATSAITVSPITGSPGGSVTRSSSDQTTYVSYTFTFSSQQTWTHLTFSDGGPRFTSGARVVFTTCAGWTPNEVDGGFSCDAGTLAGKTSKTFTVVVQTPTSGATMSVDPKATGDEVGNDNNSGHTDTFSAPNTPFSWTLSDDTTSAVTSYTNPAADPNSPAKFFTNKNLCGSSTCITKNPQWTEADVPNGLAPLGVLVSLGERSFNAGECPSFVQKAGASCFGQVSTISVGSSGPGGVFTCLPPNDFPTSCASSLVFTVRITGLTTKVNLKKVIVFHDPTGNGTYEPVPLCSAGVEPRVGDCVSSVIQDALTNDIIWTAEGPSNGSWGGAH